MSVNKYAGTKTEKNLWEAYAGESKARNRYTFAKLSAQEQNMYVLSEVFRFTAEQEEQHAKIFYELMKEASGGEINITADYPVEVTDSLQKLLDSSANNENAEAESIYPQFAEIAKQEGFTKASSKFELIAEIENIHRKRFEYFGALLRDDKLHKSDKSERWLCLNCGHIHEGTEAPMMCPVCSVQQGYFIRESDAPFTWGGMVCQG